MKTIEATAYANLAFAKYWGKAPGEGNRPATDSVGVCLDALATTTSAGPGDGSIILNGAAADEKSARKITAFLDKLKALAGTSEDLSVVSVNSFPTASGLASSSSGYAALTVAAAHALEVELSEAELSALARQGSGSAARAVPGGYTRTLSQEQEPHSVQILPAEDLPLGFAIVVVEAGEKEVSSRDGMNRTAETSSYHTGWIARAQEDAQLITEAIQRRDIARLGELAEANALAMHADALGARPPVVYFHGFTLDAFRQAAAWRRVGLEIYATCDAGPHPVFFYPEKLAAKASQAIAEFAGGRKVLQAAPAGPPTWRQIDG